MKIKYNLAVWLIVGTVVMTGLATVKPALAASTNGDLQFVPELPLPGLFDKAQPADTSLLGNYIRAMYVYFIWVVGIVATFMVIYAAVRWVAAAGNAGVIKDARDMINNAIIGVVIALTSVVLLNIINPRLTSLTMPSIRNVTIESSCAYSNSTYTDFYVCSAGSHTACGDNNTVTDPNNGSELVCWGTECKPQSGQYSICQFGIDKTTNKYQTPHCVNVVDTVSCLSVDGSKEPGSVGVANLKDTNRVNEWTGVIQTTAGFGSEYITNVCSYDRSNLAVGFVVGSPVETLDPSANASTTTIQGHTRLIPRGCPDHDTPMLMSKLSYK